MKLLLELTAAGLQTTAATLTMATVLLRHRRARRRGKP
jgi:hypothetical protein